MSFMRLAWVLLILPLAGVPAGCGAQEKPSLADEKEEMLAATDMSKLTPEMKAKVEAITGRKVEAAPPSAQ